MSELTEFKLDDRWHILRGMSTRRRSEVYRATTDELARRRADRDDAAAVARITKLESDTLAHEAAGDWHAEWPDLVAAAFPDVPRGQPKPDAARSGARVR